MEKQGLTTKCRGSRPNTHGRDKVFRSKESGNTVPIEMGTKVPEVDLIGTQEKAVKRVSPMAVGNKALQRALGSDRGNDRPREVTTSVGDIVIWYFRFCIVFVFSVYLIFHMFLS